MGMKTLARADVEIATPVQPAVWRIRTGSIETRRNLCFRNECVQYVKRERGGHLSGVLWLDNAFVLFRQ
jgi:hypothetical protein